VLNALMARNAFRSSVLLGVWLSLPDVLTAQATSSAAATTASYLSRLEMEIVREHNLARSDPERYASFLEDLRQYFQGDRLERPGEIPIITQEGKKPVDEAIRFLRRSDPLPPVTPSEGMSLGARDHVRDHGPRGGTGHTGSDGSQPWERVSRYGTWHGSMAENIAYGPNNGREVVMQLIIDDGVRDRGHRMNLFNPELRVVGVACGEHGEYRTMCVIAYAVAYTELER
jgi:uncharacterized protein YkwD